MEVRLRFALAILVLCFSPFLLEAQNTSQDINFAVNNCGIPESYFLVIPKLESATQKQLASWIAAHHCANLKAFADTRNYYGSIKLGEKPPTAPDNLSLDYLTWPELKRFTTILMSAEGVKKATFDLKPEDEQFLIEKCGVPAQDVKVIPSLSGNTQSRITSWIAAKDCRKLVPLKSTRDYYRSLQPGQKLPTPPAGWDFDYLTDQEYLRYVDILKKAPI